MSENQRLAWERKYLVQGVVWARTHDDWFEIGDGDRVLDVGSGSGKSASSLGINAIASDFSMAALRLLRDALPAVAPVCCDAAHLPFRDACFDLVRASFIFGHLDSSERESAIGEVMRVLRPGGRVAVEVFSSSDARLLREGSVTKSRLTKEDGISHFYFDEAEIRDMLSGFKGISLSEATWEQRIGPKETMRRSSFRATAVKP